VFDAIVDPDKMKKYFISEASGALTKGKEIKWEFKDVGATIDVKVLEITENAQIDFEWNASGNPPKRVTIILKPVNEQQTNIQISEYAFDFNKEGVKKALGQTQGWTDFICSMKAYFYADVNLRKGRTKDNK
jgi:uncharacterized protein YndB with AHSA1/START domain